MTRTGLLVMGFCVAALTIGGCGKTAPVANPSLVSTEDYDRVFDATVRELRERRFVVDRQDRRFGVVTTRARTASSLFEPFQPDTASAGIAGEATLNHLRRIVEVRLKPPGNAGLETPTQVPTQYELEVVVKVERRSQPNIPLTTAALGRPSLLNAERLERRLITEEGARESHWSPLDRDAKLEQRLIAAIIKRAEQP